MLNDDKRSMTPAYPSSRKRPNRLSTLFSIFLTIGMISWGHFFLDKLVDTGLDPNVFIGMLSLGMVAFVLVFTRLRDRTDRKPTWIWVVATAGFVLTVAAQALALHLFN